MATYTALEHFFAAAARTGGISLELGGDGEARRFYARLLDQSRRDHLVAALGATYPQARLRLPTVDPARLQPDEQVVCCRLELQEPDYLPLRIPHDADVTTDRAPQADPLLGVLAAIGALPRGWRALSQLVVLPASRNWAERHLRRSIEHALEPERVELYRSRQGGGWGGVSLAVLFLAAVVVLPRLWGLYLASGWLAVGAVAIPGTVLAAALFIAWARLTRRSLYDLELVKEKLAHAAARAELRLAVFAPADVQAAQVQARLDQLVSSYRAYDLERGNHLGGRPIRVTEQLPGALRAPSPMSPSRLRTFSARELAGLWHLAQAADDVAFVERTNARRFLPLPETVASGARVGLAEDGIGRQVEVRLAPESLRRHTLLVAKTRKGKSALLRQLFEQLVALPDGEERLAPAVVLVDPHSDLAAAALGVIPPEQHGRVVHLDVSQAGRRPFGLNLLDVGLGWGRDRLVENALRVFKHEFDRFWGPRMELVFRMALHLLVDANARIVSADPTGGRDRQYTILEVPRVLEDDMFRGRLLRDLDDPQLQALWRTFFKPLDHRFRLEVINPVQTKVYKFAASLAGRAIVGQARSTIDPLAWVREGAIVVVDGAKEIVGADIAALIGGTLLNQVALAIGQQAALPVERRRHVAVVVDEFHALPAADYEAFLAELAKYGASLVLATQSLGAIDDLDPGRGLRHAVFANVDQVFAFNCSAEDARVLAPELGGRVEPSDLVELGDHQCYARLSHLGERLPAFHLRLDVPPIVDSHLRETLAARSAAEYGRDGVAVAADRASLLERIDAHAPPEGAGRMTSDPENGRLPPASAGVLATPRSSRHNERRPSKKSRRPESQASLALDGEPDTSGPATVPEVAAD
jgi:hypothetical protein